VTCKIKHADNLQSIICTIERHESQASTNIRHKFIYPLKSAFFLLNNQRDSGRIFWQAYCFNLDTKKLEKFETSSAILKSLLLGRATPEFKGVRSSARAKNAAPQYMAHAGANSLGKCINQGSKPFASEIFQ